ncbi:MAG: serine hydrolase [Lachnospiraceae bacterium]|nr:serine hydrolase [Lachnospiraceae bacterium]
MADKIKKLITVLLIAAFISGAVPESILPQAATAGAAVPSVQATAYVVMDANSGDVIYKKGMNKRIYPASTAKLMTAIVAVENIKDLDQAVRFTKKIKKMVPADASKLDLKAGTSYRIKQYLNMLLISSDADSAMVLAAGSGIPYSKFIELMNSTARSYGMDKTSFDNPMGLDTGNGYKKMYTSAYDYAVLARHAMSYEIIRNIVSKKTYKVPGRKGKPSFTIKNTNGFYSRYKLKNKEYKIIGSKTGTTSAAGHVLIATARDKAGHEVICAYFGGKSSANLYNGIEKLLDYTYKQYTNEKIVLATGFWDTRFRNSEKIICKHATSGAIPMREDGKFEPAIVTDTTNTINLINSISGLELGTGTNESLTVAGLAIAYYSSKGGITGDSLTDEELNIISSLANTEEFNISEQKQIAGLYLSGAMANVEIEDAKHSLTKEETVLIADLLT